MKGGRNALRPYEWRLLTYHPGLQPPLLLERGEF